jgi:hypothetical protein
MTADSIMTRTCQPGFSASAVVAALEAGWSAIRSHHSEVPAAVVVLAPAGPAKPADGLRMGHYASLRWQHGTSRMPEVLVSGEGLNRAPAQVLTTLLHEAAHALAEARGVKDTSRQGRWHNQHFAKHAAELGLTTSKDDKLGWSPCELQPGTAARYAQVLDDLGGAMLAYRHPDDTGGGAKRANSNNGLSLSCSCPSPRKIRVSASTVDDGEITCGVCGAPFLSDEQREAEAVEMARVFDPTGKWHGGMPTFPYRMAPTGLVTRRQLRAAGLRPGGQEIAGQILWRRGKRVAYLYRLDLAVPKRDATEAQRKAIDKALLARRTCSTCERVCDYYIPRRYGECLDCAGVVTR